MGIIKAVLQGIGGGLADSWQEVLEADRMSDTTVFTKGVKVRKGDKRNNNKKGTEDTISNGSIIHVYDNQFMLLVDGGKVVDFTAEPGYYKVDNSSMPSLFAGQFGASLKETFSRVKYGGVPSSSQKVYFINLAAILKKVPRLFSSTSFFRFSISTSRSRSATASGVISNGPARNS